MMEKLGFKVDTSKGHVFQVGYLGASYGDWVNQPIISKNVPRFFDNKICEFFTRTSWWVIPLVWFPFVIYGQMTSLQRNMKFSEMTITVPLGMFIWTIVEYHLHRYIFHLKTSTYWGNTFHYFIHGFHHKYPMDKARLVFPPILSMSVILQFWVLAHIFLPYKYGPSIHSGGLLAYILYDLTHYYLHHANPRNEFMKKLKKYHLDHHYKEHDEHYGVTTPFWDRVFGTFGTPLNKIN